MSKQLPSGQSFWIRKDIDGSTHVKVRPIRWCVAFILAAAFVLSYGLDVQVLEGSMVASRLMGFHLVDLYGGLEVIAAHGAIATNLGLGMIFVAVVYWMAGGRSFCAWACPFGLLSEWGECLHRHLLKRGLIAKRKKITTRVKYVFAVSFLAASFATGYLVFGQINVVGMLSRLLIYGLLESALVIAFVLIVEVFFWRRLWCRAVCPSGAVYGLMNPVAVIRIEADRSRCDKCGVCVPECHVPEALSAVFAQKNGSVFLNSTDCTMCGKCMDACTRGVFSFSHRLKKMV
ncbi:MAG: NapH/MauN family ferredoxin-type protein [Duodenibacillus sp.]|nr:NapH/MauN family ferredoxin-type protein [Duodenibacillus sp.]